MPVVNLNLEKLVGKHAAEIEKAKNVERKYVTEAQENGMIKLKMQATITKTALKLPESGNEELESPEEPQIIAHEKCHGKKLPAPTKKRKSIQAVTKPKTPTEPARKLRSSLIGPIKHIKGVGFVLTPE